MMSLAAKRNPDFVWNEIAVILTDDRGIVPLNQAFLAKAEVTDVISFQYEPVPGDGDLRCGDIVVNVEQALRRGRPSRSMAKPSRELALYIAHGCDHLTGGTDDDPAGVRRMRRRELRWLRRADRDLGVCHALMAGNRNPCMSRRRVK